jgi:hypothetical protein
MTPTQSAHAQIAPIAVIVAGLAATDWYLDPSRGLAWLMGMGMMATAWLVAGLAVRPGRISAQTEAQRGFLILSVVFAGVMLAIALGMALAKRVGFESDEMGHRVFGVVCGAFLVVMGNTVPKVLGPLASKTCSPARLQGLQRFAGWTFVGGGLGYLAAWIFLPISLAEPMATALCALAVILVAGRLTWLFLSSRTSSPPAAR